METKFVFTAGKRRVPCFLRSNMDGTTSVRCEAAKIDQPFENADVPSLLLDIPNLIEAEKAYQEKRSEVIRVRMTSEEKQSISELAKKAGCRSISDYVRKTLLSP